MVRLNSAIVLKSGFNPPISQMNVRLLWSLLLQFAGTPHAIGIPIHQQLQHGLGVIGGVADFVRVNRYAQLCKIKSFNKSIIDPHGCIRLPHTPQYCAGSRHI